MGSSYVKQLSFFGALFAWQEALVLAERAFLKSSLKENLTGCIALLKYRSKQVGSFLQTLAYRFSNCFSVVQIFFCLLQACQRSAMELVVPRLKFLTEVGSERRIECVSLSEVWFIN